MSEKTTYDVAVIIISDSRSSRLNQDRCLPIFGEILRQNHYSLKYHHIIPDDIIYIEDEIIRFADIESVPLILTSGGTGFGNRDNTPEATKRVIHKEVPGIGEFIRKVSSQYTTNWPLTRGIAGIRNSSLIINFPGNPKSIEQCLQPTLDVIYHGIDILTKPNYIHD